MAYYLAVKELDPLPLFSATQMEPDSIMLNEISWNLHGRRRKAIPTNCLLPSTCTRWSVWEHAHTCYINKCTVSKCFFVCV